MILKNGVTEISLTADKLDMVSMNERRIVFKYVGSVWDDILYEAVRAVLDKADPESFDPEVDFGNLISGISLSIGFNIQVNCIGTYADIVVQTHSGETISRRHTLCATAEEVEHILDRYFEEGCPGVLPSFAKHFENFYLTWQSSSKRVFSL